MTGVVGFLEETTEMRSCSHRVLSRAWTATMTQHDGVDFGQLSGVWSGFSFVKLSPPHPPPRPHCPLRKEVTVQPTLEEWKVLPHLLEGGARVWIMWALESCLSSPTC